MKYPIHIHIHPDWSPYLVKFDADIAIFELEFPVTFDNYIQPICLWELADDPKTLNINSGCYLSILI